MASTIRTGDSDMSGNRGCNTMNETKMCGRMWDKNRSCNTMNETKMCGRMWGKTEAATQ